MIRRPLPRTAPPRRTVAGLRQVERGDLGVLQQLDQRMRAHHLGQAADQRRAGAVAAGVDDPGPGVGGLEPEAGAARRVRDRTERPEPEARKSCPGPSLVRMRTASGSARPSLAARVSAACWLGLSPGPESDGNAPLGPRAGAVGERFLGEHYRAVALRRPASMRVQRPAMPVPTMTGRGESHMAEIYGGKAVRREGGRTHVIPSEARDPHPDFGTTVEQIPRFARDDGGRSALPHVLTRTMSQSAARAKTHIRQPRRYDRIHHAARARPPS